MPSAWSPKDERQYGHILKSCRQRGRYGTGRCKSIAAATVNKTRSREGRTLGGFGAVRRRNGPAKRCLKWSDTPVGMGKLRKYKPCLAWLYEDGTVRDTETHTTHRSLDTWRRARGLEGLDGAGVPVAFAAMGGAMLLVLLNAAQKAQAQLP